MPGKKLVWDYGDCDPNFPWLSCKLKNSRYCTILIQGCATGAMVLILALLIGGYTKNRCQTAA